MKRVLQSLRALSPRRAARPPAALANEDLLIALVRAMAEATGHPAAAQRRKV
jgi:hypothetical protein